MIDFFCEWVIEDNMVGLVCSFRLGKKGCITE